MPIRRSFVLALAALAAAAVFGGLVHAVLVAAHVSEPAATTVHGPTVRRLWATISSVLSLVGAIVGALALTRRPATRLGTAASARSRGMIALFAGLLGLFNGGLVLAFADGGPGSGNGVVGGAAALVLGAVASMLGGLAVARCRRTS